MPADTSRVLSHARTIQREIDDFAARVTAKRDSVPSGDSAKADYRFIGVRLEKALRHIDAIIERFEK